MTGGCPVAVLAEAVLLAVAAGICVNVSLTDFLRNLVEKPVHIPPQFPKLRRRGNTAGEDFAIEEVKEDDIVLVHVAEGEIKEIMEPEVLSEVEITAFKNGSWITVDGEQYDYNDAIQYDDDVLDDYDDTNMKDTTYNVYLDAYGYAIGVEVVEESSNYLFLTGVLVSFGGRIMRWSSAAATRRWTYLQP